MLHMEEKTASPEYVLFSALGHSDPTRGNHDGAFLHILRHYKPRAAYLFFTAEIGAYDQKDDRYAAMAHRLLPACKIVKHYNPELTDPQDFNLFYQPFEQHLREINGHHPGAEILVNVSSGTPAMKSSLKLICSLSSLPLHAVQVDGPRKGGNTSKPVGEVYDIAHEWAELVENDPELEPENRCKEITVNQEIQLFARLNAKALVQQYHYRAAFALLSGIDSATGQTLQLLQAADLRLSLKAAEAGRFAEAAGYALLPIQSAGARELFEYILYLQVKQARGEILEFARAVSPIFTELFRYYLLNVYSVNIRLCCDRNKETDVYTLRRDKLKQAGYLEIYDTHYGEFRERELSFQIMLPMLEHCCRTTSRSEDWDGVQKLREFEKNVRNPCAHQLVGLTEQRLKAQFGFTTEEIIGFLHHFYTQTFKSYAACIDWDSYAKMNTAIFEMLGV